MNRTYILETDKANRQAQAANRPCSYFQPVTQITAISEEGTVKVRTETLRYAHGKDEPAHVGNLERTKRRMRTANELERVYETNAKVLGMLAYEEKIMQGRQEKRQRRANFKLNRQTK